MNQLVKRTNFDNYQVSRYECKKKKKICSVQRIKNWKTFALQELHTCNLRRLGSIGALDGDTKCYEGISLTPEAT